jgi:hypothetical protein
VYRHRVFAELVHEVKYLNHTPDGFPMFRLKEGLSPRKRQTIQQTSHPKHLDFEHSTFPNLVIKFHSRTESLIETKFKIEISINSKYEGEYKRFNFIGRTTTFAIVQE